MKNQIFGFKIPKEFYFLRIFSLKDIAHRLKLPTYDEPDSSHCFGICQIEDLRVCRAISPLDEFRRKNIAVAGFLNLE